MILSGFGSILSVSDRFYLFWIDSLHSDSSDLFYPVLDRFYRYWIDSIRFWIDSIGFGLIPSILTDYIGFRSILSAFGSISDYIGFGSTLSAYGSIIILDLSVSDRFSLTHITIHTLSTTHSPSI
jgi:hypothetical protein